MLLNLRGRRDTNPVFQCSSCQKGNTFRPPGHYDRKCEENKVVLVSVMQAYRRNTDTNPLILNLGAT